QRINFSSYPLVKEIDYYVLPLFSIISPITLVLADKWLEDGGFNLDERGAFFEKHIIETLKYELSEKSYYHKIPNISEFRVSETEFEELDLIINLKSVCVIAEVKCIKFAMDARS